VRQPLGTPKITALQHLRQTVAQPVLASFIAGGVAGAVSRTVVSPLERLKILFQIQSVGREEYKMSVPKALAKMWREEGWRGLMAGNGTNCIRIVPYSAVQFSAYNVYKRVSVPCSASVGEYRRGDARRSGHERRLRTQDLCPRDQGAT
jgi:solute carrier family 25 phosphate transporter 23/24/25/41